MPEEHEERAAYVLDGEVELAGDRFEPGRMLVFRAGDRLALRAGAGGARLLLLGAAVMDGPRVTWWIANLSLFFSNPSLSGLARSRRDPPELIICAGKRVGQAFMLRGRGS